MQRRYIKYPLRFRPVFKKTIWGGDKLVPYVAGGDDQMSDMAGGSAIGEYWGVSAMPGYESVVSNGPLEGMKLSDLTSSSGELLMGTRNFARFGGKFPLLVKFIDAAKDLSVQVHPGDELAASRHSCSGKTEMWYVIDAEKGATLLTGFDGDMTREEFEKLSGKEMMERLKKFSIASGDMFYLPAGTVHSIGAGAFIAEIQQSSDITYRIYDFERRDLNGKCRELHTEMALDAIDFSIKGENCRIPKEDMDSDSLNFWDNAVKAVDAPYFTTSFVKLKGANGSLQKYNFNFERLDSFVILTCVDGSAVISYGNGERTSLDRGNILLLPADLKEVTFEVVSSCHFLETHI